MKENHSEAMLTSSNTMGEHETGISKASKSKEKLKKLKCI